MHYRANQILMDKVMNSRFPNVGWIVYTNMILALNQRLVDSLTSVKSTWAGSPTILPSSILYPAYSISCGFQTLKSPLPSRR